MHSGSRSVSTSATLGKVMRNDLMPLMIATSRRINVVCCNVLLRLINVNNRVDFNVCFFHSLLRVPFLVLLIRNVLAHTLKMDWKRIEGQ